MKKLVSVAPMMDVTDRHCRVLMRILSRNIRLYTEMKVTGAIIHGNRDRALDFDESEHPVALQLGGCDPDELGYCAKLAGQWGYDEINLNVGCPSDRVRHARFGASLMASPDLVAECIEAMIEATGIPVTVKTRLGIDHLDTYDFLAGFMETVSDAGCRTFYLHARKAWLKGLSPKQNRSIPPLDYERVYRLKRDFPHLEIAVNGGISSISQIREHMKHVDGVMIGREAYKNLWLLREMEECFFPNDQEEPPCSGARTRKDVIRIYLSYVASRMGQGERRPGQMVRHLAGLCHGQEGARLWRNHLTRHRPGTREELAILENVLTMIVPATPIARGAGT